MAINGLILFDRNRGQLDSLTMDYPAPKLAIVPPPPVEPYDLAALQLKLLTLSVIVDDLLQAANKQAEQIARLEERVEWSLK